jgi:hypothetical protein
MKIIVDPQWNFIDALKAAWGAYPGGRELGVPNRIRVLEQWANVVGCERATAEFETVLRKYLTLDEASKNLGLSLYTIKKLRKRFGEMPSVTPFSLREGNPLDNQQQLELLQEDEASSTISEVHIDKLLELVQEVNFDLLSKLIEILKQEDIALTINERTLQQFLEISERSGINVVSRLIEWITTTGKIEDVISVLEKLEVDDLQKLNAVVGLSGLKTALTAWQNNKENDSEEFWHSFLSKNSFMFAQLFSFPVIVLKDKAYVGGKSIGNTGGNIVDFLCANHLTRNVALIEIKTPKTKLLGSKYRGDTYNISNDLSGSVVQVTNYKNSLLQNHLSLSSHEEEKFEAFDPKCIVIIGNVHSELTEKKQRKSLELFRMGLKEVQVITYDELFSKVKFLVDLLEGSVDKASTG